MALHTWYLVYTTMCTKRYTVFLLHVLVLLTKRAADQTPLIVCVKAILIVVNAQFMQASKACIVNPYSHSRAIYFTNKQTKTSVGVYG